MTTTPLSHCKHWIFDMDGTLTIAVHDFDEIRKTLGLVEGKPILEAIDELPAKEASAMMQHLFDIEMEIAGQSTQQPDAHDLLKHLAASGCTLGILTRNGVEIAAATLEAAGLAEFFDPASVLGRESCAPKPDPAGINLLLSNWQATADTTVMVGDYRFDLESGHRAGVHTVHLDVDSTEQWPELTTHRVTSLLELKQLAGPVI